MVGKRAARRDGVIKSPEVTALVPCNYSFLGARGHYNYRFMAYKAFNWVNSPTRYMAHLLRLPHSGCEKEYLTCKGIIYLVRAFWKEVSG